jgi:hypothetical protein
MTFPRRNEVFNEQMEVVLTGMFDEAAKQERVHEVLKFLLERGCSKRLFEKVLNMCGDPECDTCGELVCINGEPLHFHHDGCPACDGKTNRFTARMQERADQKWEAETMGFDYVGPDDHREPKEELGGADHAGR